jgi:hypothetical protein
MRRKEYLNDPKSMEFMVEKSSQKTAKNKFTHTRIILFFGGIGV